MSLKSNRIMIQKTIASSLILGFCLTVYLITKNFDYNWNWGKVPSFFISHSIEVQEVPIDGIFKQNSEGFFIEADNGQNIKVQLLKGYQLDVEPEMYVYQGNELAIKKTPAIGVFIKGIWLTIKISIFSGILAFILGLFAGMARLSKNPIFAWPSYLYIELIRGTPLLVQLFIIYFLFGTVLGIDNRFICGVLALGLFGGAYSAEVIRSGVQSIDIGQMEAARSLGMNYLQAMVHVIFPQMLRRSVAALAGIFISLIKDSSLVSVMALTDLTKAGREVVSTSFMVFEVWIVVALLYFLMTYGASYLTAILEKRLSLGESRGEHR